MSVRIDTSDGEDELLTSREAQNELGISKATFYRLRSRGLLRTLEHGGYTYVRRKWITEYWDKLSREAERPAARRRKRSAA